LLDIVSRVSFYIALLLSSLLTLVLLSAAANFGFGQVIAGGPSAIFICAAMLLNPLVFGFLGLVKGTPQWRLIGAGAMMILLLLYALLVYGHFGPISDW